jgi:hypothetical protein
LKGRWLALALGLAACVDLTRPPLPDGNAPPPADAADADGGVDDAPLDAPGDDAIDAPPDVPDLSDAADARDAGVDTGTDVPPSTLGMGLIGYWTLDGISSSKALDSTANHNDAFIEGLPSVVTGSSGITFTNGGAYAFRGLDDAAWVPPADALTPTRFSVALWVRFDSLSNRGKCGGVADGTQYLLFRRNAAAGNGIAEAVALFKQADNTLAFMLRDGNGVAHTAPSTTTAQRNSWLHLVATYDNSTGSNGQMRLYVNGNAEGAASHPQGVTFDPAGRLWMARSGECRDSGLGVTNFDGKLAGILDDVRLYGRVLSAGEASALAMGRN